MSAGAGRAHHAAALLITLVSLFAVVAPSTSIAHEVRPAYLELKEEAPGLFGVLFKTPMIGDLRLALGVSFSGRVEPVTPVLSRVGQDALIQTWQVRAADTLSGQSIRVRGMENTLSDALLRVEFANGRTWTQRLTPAAPEAHVPAALNSSGVAVTYLWLGAEHILLGYDHLLFVLGLILLAANMRQLVAAITAFTAAHSVTLAAAALGWVQVPPKPVEAVIALSIAFVAAEILHTRSGQAGIAARAPWLVAFTFGLLHGFGFAGALSEVGLPEGYIPVALLFFNLGVEAGQLVFVALVILVIAFIRRSQLPLPKWSPLVPPYFIGSFAMFWVVQRIAAF